MADTVLKARSETTTAIPSCDPWLSARDATSTVHDTAPVALLDEPEQEAEAGELTGGEETMVALVPRAKRSKCIAFGLHQTAWADE